MTTKHVAAREWQLYIVALLAAIYVVTWRVLARPREVSPMDVATPSMATTPHEPAARPQLVRAPQPHVVRTPPRVVRVPARRIRSRSS